MLIPYPSNTFCIMPSDLGSAESSSARNGCMQNTSHRFLSAEIAGLQLSGAEIYSKGHAHLVNVWTIAARDLGKKSCEWP
jgi:hypothetical protein